MNNKGFTLIELLATLVILAIVMSIGTFSIISIVNNSKKKNYEVLITNIKDAAELYYQECRFSNNSAISCTKNGSSYQVTLGSLVSYGYLKGNAKDNDRFILVNPNDEVNISSCTINVSYQNNKIKVDAADNPVGSCPKQADYDK